MGVTVLSVGAEGTRRHREVSTAIGETGASGDVMPCPDPGDRVGLDRILDAAAGRLVLAATGADLAAVLRRMGRRGELRERETGWLPLDPVPAFLARCGVSASLDAAAAVAVDAPVRTVGLLADDSGGLLVDSAVLRPWTGRRLWVRAFVDDEKVCDGEVTSLRVSRPEAGVLRVAVTGRFARTVAQVDGRAAQLVCDEAALSSDGVARERPRRKRTWWNEPDLWRLALPADPG